MKKVNRLSRELEQALQYFRKKKGFYTLFLLFRKKYESFGRFTGTVDLSKFTNEDIEQFALFMGQHPHHMVRKGKLKIAEFEQCIQQTKFSGISLHQLLEAYFNERLVSKKKEKEELAVAQAQQLEQFKIRYPNIIEWFNYLEGRTSDTHWIWKLFGEQHFKEDVQIIAEAYDALPEELERYPIFSQRVTGDPHALDVTGVRGKLWIHVLYVMAGGQGPMPRNTESLNELLLQYKLLRDDIQNFVTQANLLAYIEKRIHPVWSAALETQFVLNVPMRELLKISKATTARITENEQTANVYIVENSGVFSALLDAVPTAPLICTHGQFKLAALQLLDLLVESGHILYYSGDFDPEGLLMAQRLKERYGEQVRFWRMSVSDYKLTNPIVELEDRVAKLASLLDSELRDTALAMKATAKAGYQEAILDMLIDDLKNDD